MDGFVRAYREVVAANIIRRSRASSSYFGRNTDVNDIAKQVVEGVIGERNNEFTTDFVLDQLGEDASRYNFENTQNELARRKVSERRTLPVPGGLCVSGTSLVGLLTTASCWRASKFLSFRNSSRALVIEAAALHQVEHRTRPGGKGQRSHKRRGVFAYRGGYLPDCLHKAPGTLQREY